MMRCRIFVAHGLSDSRYFKEKRDAALEKVYRLFW